MKDFQPSEELPAQNEYQDEVPILVVYLPPGYLKGYKVSSQCPKQSLPPGGGVAGVAPLLIIARRGYPSPLPTSASLRFP